MAAPRRCVRERLTGEAVGAVERVGELVAALLAGEAD